MWSGRRYVSLDHSLKQEFHEKLYKLSLSGGMSCPNRDGTISFGGCSFCSGKGSGDFAAPEHLSIDEQIEFAKQLVSKKYTGERYIAYFQSFTNTYAPVERLRELYLPVVRRKDIAVLDIATRPDCLEDEKIALLKELSAYTPIWVELGLQTANENTALRINRGYQNEVYQDAAERLHAAGIKVITHIILGLPDETREDMLYSARYAAECGTDGIKLQLLHILRNTPLAALYAKGAFQAMEEETYISIVCDIIARLPENVVIHRLTGDGDKKQLIAPLWSLDKRHVLNRINQALRERNIIQGMKRSK